MGEGDTVVVQFLLKWLHVLAGIMWIGLLYFFNLINGVVAKTFDAETKKKVVPELMPRALWWFRWGAMVTFLTGVAIIYLKYFMDGTGMKGDAGLMTTSGGQWISLGTLLGTIMWFNVWFIIWPAQKKIIGWIKKGEANPEAAGLVKKATLASRVNTYFSVPLVFAMLAGAGHFVHSGPGLMAGVLAGGFLITWIAIKHSAKVGIFED